MYIGISGNNLPYQFLCTAVGIGIDQIFQIPAQLTDRYFIPRKLKNSSSTDRKFLNSTDHQKLWVSHFPRLIGQKYAHSSSTEENISIQLLAKNYKKAISQDWLAKNLHILAQLKKISQSLFNCLPKIQVQKFAHYSSLIVRKHNFHWKKAAKTQLTAESKTSSWYIGILLNQQPILFQDQFKVSKPNSTDIRIQDQYLVHRNSTIKPTAKYFPRSVQD